MGSLGHFYSNFPKQELYHNCQYPRRRKGKYFNGKSRWQANINDNENISEEDISEVTRAWSDCMSGTSWIANGNILCANNMRKLSI